jgi:hypothetical protein
MKEEVISSMVYFANVTMYPQYNNNMVIKKFKRTHA